jgi:glycosyltransferase involved in cell wall biosynthesis
MNHMLSIVIPAYNEEDSIRETVQKTLDALPAVQETANLASVEILVVNDGSRDSTPDLVRQILSEKPEVADKLRLVEHDVNRGYGAAIKTGFLSARGDLLGFMDADGTCEPAIFGDLVNALKKEEADVAIGSRMVLEDTGMPATRRLGNKIFANLLSLIGSTRVTDSASGMRVLRRRSMPLLSPLPDGLHFTPAMSARAVLNPNLKIVEVPMPYHERVGESKLGVVRDGWRFLTVILEIALTYRPLRFFGGLGILFLLAALAYGLWPVLHYIRHQEVFEWMIYRLLAVTVFTVAGINLIAIGLLADFVVRNIQRRHRVKVTGKPAPWHVSTRMWERGVLGWMPGVGILLALLGVIFNRAVIWEYLSTGHITAHWTYPVTGAFFVLTGLQLFSFGIIYRTFAALVDQESFFPAGDGEQKD